MTNLALALALGLLGQSAYEAKLPELHGRVNDLAGILSPPRAQALEQGLERYEQHTGHQFALLTIDTLGGLPLEEYSIKLAEKWKLGDPKRDDGLIFLVVKNDRKMRIEVGYGLEGAIPDLVAKRVLDHYATPHFRSGDFPGGIELSFEQLMKAASGEALGPPPPTRRTRPELNSPAGGTALTGILVVFFIISFAMAIRFLLPPLVGTFLGYLYMGPAGGIIGLLVGIFITLTVGPNSRSGGGAGRSGSRWSSGSSFGGFSSGGFSGGGGRFGGGGASGGW
jgi:uncharacterized protein